MPKFTVKGIMSVTHTYDFEKVIEADTEEEAEDEASKLAVTEALMKGDCRIQWEELGPYVFSEGEDVIIDEVWD